MDISDDGLVDEVDDKTEDYVYKNGREKEEKEEQK